MDLNIQRIKILTRLQDLGAEYNNAKKDNDLERFAEAKNKVRVAQKALSIVDAILINPNAARLALPELFKEE